jgi:hypothetical protein
MKKLVVLFGIVLVVLIGCKTGTISNDKIFWVFETKAIAPLLVPLPSLKMMVLLPWLQNLKD